jgi:hypothetical protein
MRSILIAALFSFCVPGISSGQQYLFYLHGMIIENQGPDAVSPEYGKYEYRNILSTFTNEKFTVISEVRAKGTDPETYARKVVKQIDSLIKKGTKPQNITVVGASKGCVIAIYVSSFLKNKDVNFVFLAGCFSGMAEGSPGINFCGNILSIYERSDDIGRSCAALKKRSSLAVPHYKEIELNTGLKHGFLYRPLKEWVGPAVSWAHHNYE